MLDGKPNPDRVTASHFVCQVRTRYSHTGPLPDDALVSGELEVGSVQAYMH